VLTTKAIEGALQLLQKKGRILDVAREVSRVMARSGIDGVVIGGVAVVLHGYVRTTIDVDVFVASDLGAMKRALEAAGFDFDKNARRYWKGDVAVHLVSSGETEAPLGPPVEIDGIRTVAVEDLIRLKLRSGLDNLARAIDIADVVGLIRIRNLSPEFASRLPKDLRSSFRKIVRAVRKDARRKAI
jgi:hypothetical protein